MNESSQSVQTVVEQFPCLVHSFSSQYGSNTARSYAIANICKTPRIYPHYGDSTEALVFRTYGPWWINLPSFKETRKNFKRLENGFTSRDFIEIEYSNLVYACKTLNIYETYNPGSLEVVYAGEEHSDGNIIWHRVWKFPELFSIVLKDGREILIENGGQRMVDLFPDHVNTVTSALHSLSFTTDHEQISRIYTRHTYPPAARLPRILKIPLENKISFPTRHIRLEFDHSTANYYIEIDSIGLWGDISHINQTKPIKTIHEQKEDRQIEIEDSLTKLPFDVLAYVCSFLDLHSLMQLSMTCSHLRKVCLHPLQFKSLDLKPFWNCVTNESIATFFRNHCTQTRYLSLSWTKSIQFSTFSGLLNSCSNNLIQLDLACCPYLTEKHVEAIGNCCPNLEILNFENCSHLNSQAFIPLTNLFHIRTLNVYRTKIDYRTLLPLIENNKKHLENINLGSCQNLLDSIGIVRLIFARCCQIRSIDLWRVSNLTQNLYLSIVGLPFDMNEDEQRFEKLDANEIEDLSSIYSLINMPVEITSLTHLACLSEVDIGWADLPTHFVKHLVCQAGHSLIKLFLTACRRISDEDMIAISENCLKLRQFDVLGCNLITEYSIECILKQCVHLEFIDLSFCSNISDAKITIWMTMFKHCFKRSYQPFDSIDVDAEYP